MENTYQSPKTFNLTSVVMIVFASIIGILSGYTWFLHRTLGDFDNDLKSFKRQLIQQSLAFEQIQKETEASVKQHLDQHIANGSSSNSPHESEPISQFAPINLEQAPGFKQLIGFKDELVAIEGMIDYIKNKDNYINIGKVDAPTGILMHGTPGTGKTTLARAFAKEVDLPFFEVGSSIFSQTYKGIAPQMVKDLFKQARIEATKRNGAIIFLDECETIFADLSKIANGRDDANVVNQFKTEMTSTENDPNKPIFIIGATNHCHKIDEAIRSRFTYNIEVKTGTKADREQFLNFLIKQRGNPYSDEAVTYLHKVINEALEKPETQDIHRANRTLENLLKSAVSTFSRNRNQKDGTKRDKISKEDLKQAYRMIISTDTKILDDIEKSIK